ncbi:MAG TPA: hypothetical protein VLB83_04465 [Candidatus Paceibacterota bacterium]|nr:hypothetical protein [Candidatus Paceibacterota bacterium]
MVFFGSKTLLIASRRYLLLIPLIIAAGLLGFIPSAAEAAPSTVVTGVVDGWAHSKSRPVLYNGQYFFLVYHASGGNLYYKSSADAVTWSATSTLLSTGNTPYEFDMFQVDDGKFDLVTSFTAAANPQVTTCAISGAAITCGATTTVSSAVANLPVSITRTPYTGRVWVAVRNAAELEVWSANTAGDVTSSMTFTDEVAGGDANLVGEVTMVPYSSGVAADRVLVIYARDPGGTGSDGIYSRDITDGGGAGTRLDVQLASTQQNTNLFGNAIRISDAHFKFIFRSVGSALPAGGTGVFAHAWNGTSWFGTTNIDSEIDEDNLVFAYNSHNDSIYALANDTAGTASIERWYRPSGAAWGTEVSADGAESTARSLPVTQAQEPAMATSTILREQFILPWAYRVANGSTFDLKVDGLALGGTTTLRAFNFLNDNGATVDAYTARAGLATSTIATNVKKGERMIVRFQVDNKSIATSTKMYRLQWENATDAAGVWNDLGTTTQIRWAYSEKGAPLARQGFTPLPTNQSGTCNSGSTYVAGRFVSGTGTSAPISLPPGKCTELAFAIETSGATLGKTYRYRLVNGLTGLAFDATILGGTYSTYASSTIETVQSIRYSKEARGGTSDMAMDAANGNNNGWYIDAAMGSDGFPVFSYNDSAASSLKFIKCGDIACSSSTVRTLIKPASQNALAIGTDGNPILAYYSEIANDLHFMKCGDLSCSATTSVSLHASANVVGQAPSMAIGTDGNPVISYYDSTDKDLEFVKCHDTSCTTSTQRTLDDGGDTSVAIGAESSITVGPDGYPVIVYEGRDINTLLLIKCTDAACSTTSTSTTVIETSGGSSPSAAMNADGFLSVAYYTLSGGDLKFIKCANTLCTSRTTRTLATSYEVSWPPVLLIGADGNPLIVFRDSTTGANKILALKCHDSTCGTYSISVVKSTGASASLGVYRSAVLAPDGNPVILTQIDPSGANDKTPHFIRCSTIDCAPVASSTANLLGTNADLRYFLDDAGYTNVASSDNTYDSITAATSTRLAYVFKKTHTNNTDQIDVSWEGQVSIATTTYLKIYNYSSGAWETLASNTPSPATDFTLSGVQSSNLSNYYDGGNTVSLRLETGTTTKVTTLKTDQITITLSAPAAVPTIVHYRWREDNGTETAASYAAAEDTALAPPYQVYLGDRRRLRVAVSNGGGVPASNITYRLEYASSSCSSWIAVPSFNTQTTQEWVTDLSQWLPDGVATTHSSGMTVPPGKSFVAGQAKLHTNQTSAHTLSASEYTELEYALRSTSFAQSNLLYCFRVTNAGSASGFSYQVRPELTLNPNFRPQTGGAGTEAIGAGSQRNNGQNSGGSGTESSGSGSTTTGGGAGGGGDSG